MQGAVGNTDFAQIESKILFLFESRLDQVLAEEVKLMENVANSLGKPMPQINFHNDNYIIPDNLKPTLRKVFIHLFRNFFESWLMIEFLS